MSERTHTEKAAISKPSFTPIRTGLLQRKCACGGTLGPGGECAGCRRVRQASYGRSANQPASTSSLSEQKALRSPGRYSGSTVHDPRGSRLGHDFSKISAYPERNRRTRTTRDTVSLFETNEGTETLDPGGRGTKTANGGSPDGGGAPAATGCSVTGSFSSIPSGSVPATLTGSKLGASFSMVGDFTPSIPCTCSCGEYRQYVRGSFTRNGSPVTHALCGTNLDPRTYQEDCGIFGGRTYKYGYRSNPFATSKFTGPDQATGCRFEGSDAPGITGSSGDRLAVNLDFTGALVDTCNGNRVLASSAWTVSGAATVP